MPNWCINNITFYSKNHDLLETFRNNLCIWTSKEGYENTFGKNWLGNVLYHVFGKEFVDKTVNMSSITSVDYRGWIEYIDEQVVYNEKAGYFTFRVDTETAWYPHIIMWIMVLCRLYPNKEIKYAYTAYESGLGIDRYWDPDNIILMNHEEYVIHSDCHDNDIEYIEYTDYEGEYITKADAIYIVKKLFGIDCSDYINALDRINNEIKQHIHKLSSDNNLRFIIVKIEESKTGRGA